MENCPAVMNPYSSPQQEATLNAPEVEPKSIQVFGILHLVFGSIGALSVILGFVFVFAVEPLFEFLAKQVEESEENAEMAETLRVIGEISASQRAYSLINTVISAVLVVLLLRAGYALVKRRKSAVRQSNVWCWLSIIFTVLSIPLVILYSQPAQLEMMEKIESVSGGTATSASDSGSALGEMIGAVLGPLVYLIYPVLTLVFLKRSQVGAYLAHFGK